MCERTRCFGGYPDEAFDFPGQPDGSCRLPGEAARARLYLRLGRACEAALTDEVGTLRAVAAEPTIALPEGTTEPVREGLAAHRRAAS